jgi:hypothetical protein
MRRSKCHVVELRQYTLKPGQRDVLIELFEREFIESQEALGMEVIGTFRDADNPDRFVWLRGFPDMEARAKSLAAFYGGPVWKAHREVANATMLDSDNVLLLRPAWNGSDFPTGGTRAPVGTAVVPRGIVTATICYLDAAVPDGLIQAFRTASAALSDTDYAPRLLGAFVTDHSPNTFPALPVREGENVFVWFSLFPDSNKAGSFCLPPEEHSLVRTVETLRLIPTARSRLHA